MTELQLFVRVQPNGAKHYNVNGIGSNAEQIRAEVLKYAPEGAIWERSERQFETMRVVFYCGARWIEHEGKVICRTGRDKEQVEFASA